MEPVRKTYSNSFLSISVKDGVGILKVRQATKKEYIECVDGGVFDIAYPKSRSRRARVSGAGKITSALMAGECTQCLFKEYKI